MVEVAGIEPASKDKPKAESTYLVICYLNFPWSNNQNLTEKAAPNSRSRIGASPKT